MLWREIELLRFDGHGLAPEIQGRVGVSAGAACGSAEGRFTQVDPIEIAGGMNTFGFANGDPVTCRDPFGLRPPSDFNLCGCAPGVTSVNRRQTGRGILAHCVQKWPRAWRSETPPLIP